MNMKHRGILFSVIFIGCIILLYGHPIWFPQVSTPATDEVRREPSPTSWNYNPIKADGFAHWIGEELSDFNKVYGNPEETYPSGFSFTIQHYELENHTHLEVTAERNRVTSIKFLGTQDEEITPFHYGMTMNDLTKLTMVYPNFTIDYENHTVGFELMEDDMNYRPLIAFDNGTFAILFFSQKKTESALYSVMYLDKPTLLKLAPYQITEGSVPRFYVEENADWDVINQSKQQQSRHTFQYLRQTDKRPAFLAETDTQIAAEQLLGEFTANSEDFLTTEKEQKLRHIQKGEEVGQFSAGKSELAELLEKYKMKEANLYLELPIYDPTFTILTWYSTPYLHTRFLHQESESLGIAFSKENMVVLLQSVQNKVEDSDDN